MTIDKGDVFAKSFIFRKVRRKIKEKMTEVAASFPVEDLNYAARVNKDIVGWYLSRLDMTQHQRRKKAAPWKDLLKAITADDLLALVNEVSPAHAQVLAANRGWFDAQVEKLRDDLGLTA